MTEDEPSASRPVGRRARRPRMAPFLVTGTLLGALAGVVLSVAGPAVPQSGPGQEGIVLAIVGGIVGLLAGSLLYLAAERRSR